MCIICVKPEGMELQDEVLQTMWDSNSHGAGLMYAKDGQLTVKKGLMTFEEFLAAYKPIEQNKLVLHFRIRTHGEKDASMTHPFEVDNNLAFVHNGVISGMGNQTHSDTWEFNEKIVKTLRASVSNFLQIDPIIDLISSKIGASKLVFMDNQGNTSIINEKYGEQSSDGIWFSNGSWKPKPKFTPTVYYPQQTTRRSESQSQSRIQTADTSQMFVGDYAIFNSAIPVHAYPAGIHVPATTIDVTPMDVVKISAFNQDLSVDVYSYEHKRALRVRSIIYMDKLENEAYLRKQWGHMSAGTKLIVVTTDNNKTECFDTRLCKIYSIPTRLLYISKAINYSRTHIDEIDDFSTGYFN